MADESIPEEWRPVEGWPYEVSNLGRVRRSTATYGRTKPGKILKFLSTSSGGYYKVILCRDGKTREFRVHQLVCSAFNGPKPADKDVVAHKDGNPKNNVPNNLYWATYLENSADAIRHGTVRCGEGHNFTKLSDTVVAEIMRNGKMGLSYPALGRKYGISANTVWRILNALTRKSVTCVQAPTNNT